MKHVARTDLIHDLILPTLLFAALGGMTWAVRGCSGFGGSAGCIFAGVVWGTAWWFLSRDEESSSPRRYTSGWIVLAMTVGVGLSGARGWMQWSSFFEGKLQTNTAAGEFVTIPRIYGFLWLCIAGVPWAGVGACLLAWCGSLRETRAWHWGLRIALGIAGILIARFLFRRFPEEILPLYDSLESRYKDSGSNPNLGRLINDCRSAVMHLGLYLGLLLYEILRRDWKNVVLIQTVGVVNGLGWALCQNWKWAPSVWPGGNFNWWRCWESSGGISIGVAFGLAYFLVNRRMSEPELANVHARRNVAGPKHEWLIVWLGITGALLILILWARYFWGVAYLAVLALFGIAYYFRGCEGENGESKEPTRFDGDPNLQCLGLYVGLLFGLGLSLRNGLKGWFNIYRGNEEYWSRVLTRIFAPGLLIGLVLICGWILLRPLPLNFRGELFPHRAKFMWLVLVVANVIAQLVTGPPSQWNEFAFSIYYVLLFAITAVIVIHYSARQRPVELRE